ncbi:MAG: hypothetical protein QNI96_05105 [Woeseiaceae bacterium]|nr:hypothetical protein [Woeseiaceae bacterium]
MKKIVIALLLSSLSVTALANGVWLKQSQWYAQDAFGRQVVVCSWKRQLYGRPPQYAQTQGVGFCPMPMH